MNRYSWPVLALGAGIVLMFVAPLLVAVAPSGAFWSEADQAQYQKVSGDFHAASSNLPQAADGSMPVGRDDSSIDPVAAKADYEAKKADFEKQKARLNAAQSRPSSIKWLLRILGMIAAAAGAVGYFREKQAWRPPSPPAKKTAPSGP